MSNFQTYTYTKNRSTCSVDSYNSLVNLYPAPPLQIKTACQQIIEQPKGHLSSKNMELCALVNVYPTHPSLVRVLRALSLPDRFNLQGGGRRI